MKKRLFLYTTALLITGLLCFFAITIYITRSNNLEMAKDMVIETARNYAGLYKSGLYSAGFNGAGLYDADPDGGDFNVTGLYSDSLNNANLYGAGANISSFVKTSGDIRITVIAADGTVLADSRPLDIASLENHLNRPEIQAADRGAPEAFVRHSDSLGVDFVYYALKVPNRDSYIFLRAAVPVAKIDSYLLKSLPLFVIVLLAAASLSFALSRFMITKITKPFEDVGHMLRLLSGGEYAPEPVAGSYEEINQIIEDINEIAKMLQKSFGDLRDEKHKLGYILDNIGDSLIVLDSDKNISLINASALSVFGVSRDIVGKNLNYLSFDKALTEAVDECVVHEKAVIFELNLEGRIFLVVAKRLPDTDLTMVALSDVTENRASAKRREEFFANASHELKTPLTAIKGFNELMVINNKDEKIGKFIDGISRETGRMLTLIGDMLKLSELENTQCLNPSPVSLAKVAKEAGDALSPVINEKSIVFEISGDAVISAEYEHVYELIKNLVENAARYNNNGGSVFVKILSDKKRSRLCVKDDGIGISPEEQARIFERFYRVEKSRSSTSGGTGLGLSIVKHICALYDWELSLKSKLGTGTEVIVVF